MVAFETQDARAVCYIFFQALCATESGTSQKMLSSWCSSFSSFRMLGDLIKSPEQKKKHTQISQLHN